MTLCGANELITIKPSVVIKAAVIDYIQKSHNLFINLYAHKHAITISSRFEIKI